MQVKAGTLATLDIVQLRPRTLAWVLTVTPAALVVAHVVVQAVWGGSWGRSEPFRPFDLDDEGTIPSWYSSSTLFLASLYALAIGRSSGSHDRTARQWFGLSVIFLGLSIDEAAAIHERATGPFRRALNLDGLLSTPGWYRQRCSC